jgi:hypothetical protein
LVRGRKHGWIGPEFGIEDVYPQKVKKTGLSNASRSNASFLDRRIIKFLEILGPN